MKVEIVNELCSGHGRCWELAPEVFHADDDGFNADKGSVVDIPPGLEEHARLGVRSCPERALRIVEK